VPLRFDAQFPELTYYRNGGNLMFDNTSDFALNKLDREAIVCKSATGLHIRLTREDFVSEEEFKHWKKWSDGDYKKIESEGRGFYDNCVSFSEASTSLDISAEDIFFAPLVKVDQEKQRAAILQQVKSVLTKTQFRRLWMYCINAMTVEAIAADEHIAHQNVSKSIRAAWVKIKKFLVKL